MRWCQKCGKEISAGRLAILPETLVCVKCSRERPVIGVAEWQSKSTCEIVLVRPEDKNAANYAMQELTRGFQRLSSARGGLSFKQRGELHFF